MAKPRQRHTKQQQRENAIKGTTTNLKTKLGNRKSPLLQRNNSKRDKGNGSLNNEKSKNQQQQHSETINQAGNEHSENGQQEATYIFWMRNDKSIYRIEITTTDRNTHWKVSFMKCTVPEYHNLARYVLERIKESAHNLLGICR